jgi:hypothetical protein
MAAPYTLLIEKDGTNKFWHTHNGITAGRFAIEGDFTFTIDGNKCKVVEKDGASRFVYLAENISIKDNTDAGVLETGFSPVSLRNRLRELGYPKEDSIEVLGLTTDELDAIHNAASPSASNPFATMDDVGSGGSSGLSFHANAAAFPATGNTTTLYIDKANERIYRWNGTGYVAQDWQNQSDVLLKGNRPMKLVDLDAGDYTFVAGDERKVIYFYGTSNTSVIKFPNQVDASTPFKEGDELICINGNDPTEYSQQDFNISNISSNGDYTNFQFLSIAHIRLIEAGSYGWFFSYENSRQIDALKLDGSNANTNVDLGSFNLTAQALTSLNRIDGSGYYLINTGSGQVGLYATATDELIAVLDTNGDKIYKYGNGHLTYNETTNELKWDGNVIATLADIPSLSGYATESYANSVSATAENNAKTYADGLVAGLLDLRGNHNASGNTYPSSGGSGAAGAILKGDFWYISVAGTLGGVAVNIGDSIYALVNSPGTTSSNWAVLDANVGYVPEDTANKSTSVTTDQASNTKFPSVKSVFDWATNLFATKVMGAYKFRVNNTNASANATEVAFKDLGKQTYTETMVFTGGSGPSGSASLSYSAFEINNFVFLNITGIWGTAGSGNVQVVIPLPSGLPSPVKPDGLTANSDALYICTGKMSTASTTVLQAATEAVLRTNSGGTGFEIVIVQAAIAAKVVKVSLIYPKS